MNYRMFLRPVWAGGMAAFIVEQLLVEWPEGDPDKIDQVAALSDEVAAALIKGRDDLKDVVALVVARNSGAGVDAFARYWTVLYAYVSAVADYCRRFARANREYARTLRTTQQTLVALAIENMVELLWAVAWAWTGAGSAAMSKWLADRLYRRIQAKLLLGILRRLTSWIMGSLVFSLGDETLLLGAKLATGQNPGSAGDIALGELKDFAANMAFFSMWDAARGVTKLGPMTRLFPDNGWGNELGDVVAWGTASTAYTVVNNAENGKDWKDLLPSGTVWTGKALIITGQRTELRR